MKPENQRIIVTGGAGFIGSHVVDLLAANGNHVVVIDNLSTGSLDNLGRHLHGVNGSETNGSETNGSETNGKDTNGSETNGKGTNGDRGKAPGTVEFVEADIRDADAMHQLVADADVVIHMAVACIRTSLNQPELVHEVNATGTLNVGLAAHRNNVGRLLYVSSSEAYGTARCVPMAEDHPMEPTTVYGASKLVGEAYSLALRRTHGMEVTVVRPFNTYGPREPHRGLGSEVIPKFVMRTIVGSRPVIFGSGLQTRDFTWVEDTARGICAVAAEDKLVGQTVNIARGQEISIRQLAEKVLAIFDRCGEQPVFDEPRPGDLDRHLADTTKATCLIGWQPTVSIDEGLRRYVDWVDEQGIDAERWLAEDSQRNW